MDNLYNRCYKKWRINATAKECFLKVVEQNQVEDQLAMSIANMIMSRCFNMIEFYSRWLLHPIVLGLAL